MLSMVLLWYLLTLSCSLLSPLSCRSLIQDEISSLIVFLTCFVLLSSLCFSTDLIKNSQFLYPVYLTLFISCFIVFCSSSTFLLYFFYELALLPILFIIVSWGTYPDRALGSLILFVYTAVFTLPFLWGVLFLNSINCSFSLLYVYPQATPRFMVTFLTFLAFSVKLPVYGLHLWLPMAHVEAPTRGSMILAGVLLKLGGVGLIRFNVLIGFSSLHSFLSYLFISLVYSTLICSFQSDFKRMVAYSSVSHIIIIPILILADNILRLKCAILIIVFHGLSSPIIFIIVRILYSSYGTRQLISLKSSLLISPILGFLIVLGFFFSVSAPPFPSFTAEAYRLISCRTLSSIVFVFLGFYVFFSMVYNCIWVSSILLGTSSQSKLNLLKDSLVVSLFRFIPIFIAVLLSFVFLLIFICV